MRLFFRRLILLALFFSVGCASAYLKKTPELKFSSLPEWPAAYQKNFKSLKTIQSRARITVESPEFATNFNARLIYAAPDTVFLQAEGPLGLDIGKIFIGKYRFIVYNQYNNQFFSGSLDETYYSTFLQTDVTFRQLKNAFVGYVPLPDNLMLADEQHGIFSAVVNGTKWRFAVNVNSGILESWEVIKDNQVSLKQEFKNYRVEKGILVPGLIRLVLPLKKEMVAIFHKNIKINEKLDPDSYHIEIGPKVKQLIVGER
ncbi:MAG: DUF4292 domain-containing protein [Calditrichia bacterium]